MAQKNKKILISWIGGNDLIAEKKGDLGPILSTLKSHSFDAVELLYNYDQESVDAYLNFLNKNIQVPINAYHEQLSSPVDFGAIYQVADKHLKRLQNKNGTIAILLSPGTPAMQAVWILLAKTKYETIFYQSSLEEGAKEIEIPFEISAEYTPVAQNISSEKFTQLTNQDAPVHAAFKDILTRNVKMKNLISQAEILALKNVPILINGETGTGKELFARAIHNSSPRAAKPFVAINCGAFPKELIDDILFGHKKGAFTGALQDKYGLFQQADKGTLFLDEFGELTPEGQVRLLRVLQEGTFTQIGGAEEIKCDVRIITATHRNLIEAVGNGTFREDLFYRVAVGIIDLPPLREREGDLSLLTDAILAQINDSDDLLKHKYISAGARNVILNHRWKGNIRELQSSLVRAVIWCQGDEITAQDMEKSLFSIPSKNPTSVLLDVSQGVDIQSIIEVTVTQYIREALKITHHNKTRASELLGLKNYQTLNNWMEKYSIK